MSIHQYLPAVLIRVAVFVIYLEQRLVQRIRRDWRGQRVQYLPGLVGLPIEVQVYIRTGVEISALETSPDVESPGVVVCQGGGDPGVVEDGGGVQQQVLRVVHIHLQRPRPTAAITIIHIHNYHCIYITCRPVRRLHPRCC